jgi:cytochrome b
MRDYFDNEVILVVLATLVVLVILGVFGWLKFRRDEQIVMDFLKNSGVENHEDSTKTAAILKKVKSER